MRIYVLLLLGDIHNWLRKTVLKLYCGAKLYLKKKSLFHPADCNNLAVSIRMGIKREKFSSLCCLQMLKPRTGFNSLWLL